MGRAKTSREHEKFSRKSKSKGFDINAFAGVKLKKGIKLDFHDPTIGLCELSSVSPLLMDALLDADLEAFKDILGAHISIVGKEAVAKASGVSLRTIFRMLEPESNPTLNNLAKVFKALRAVEKASQQKSTVKAA